jgi:hypothetical protein
MNAENRKRFFGTMENYRVYHIAEKEAVRVQRKITKNEINETGKAIWFLILSVFTNRFNDYPNGAA